METQSMIDDLRKELASYHATYLAALEDLEHILQISSRAQHAANAEAGEKDLERAAALRGLFGLAMDRVLPVVNDAASAKALLRRGVDAGLITHKLGRPGEDAVDLIHGAPMAKEPQRVLCALVAGGRLTKPTVARCVRCLVTRPIEQLDDFTSTTSPETIFVCHGPQPLPKDRLGLKPAMWWDDAWGEPCSEEYSWA
jgi:hypothetical protein